MPYAIPEIQYVEVNKNLHTPPLSHPATVFYPFGGSKTKPSLQLGDIASYSDEQQKQAIAYYRKILRSDPDQHFAAFNLGLFYFLRKEFIPAYACFENAQKAATANIYSTYYLGKIAFELQDYKTSLSFFQALQLHECYEQLSDKDQIDLKLYTGRICMRLHKIEEAVDIFLAIAMNESYGQSVAVHQLAHLYMNVLNNFHLAEPWIDQALMLPVATPVIISSKILILKATGRLQEAMPYLEEMTRLEPNSFEPFYDLACLFAERNDEPATREFLEKAVRLNAQAKSYARSDIDFAHYFMKCWFKNLMK